MITFIKRYVTAVVLTVLSLTIIGCSSGSDISSSSQSGTGSVAILLTDAPIDNFDKFLLTVSEISLLGDDGHVTLFSGSETIDLLDLNSHSDLFSLADNIPAGKYNKIRMRISDPQLISLDMDGNVITVVPKSGGNGKLDLNPRGDINVSSGETLAIQIDLDVEKSIHLIETGNGDYRFRPVVFVDILNDDMQGKLVRISGYARNIEEDHFELCQQEAHDDTKITLPPEKYDDDDDTYKERCVDIFTDSSTSYFNDQGIAESDSALNENNPITILGYYRNIDDDKYMGFNAEVIELAAADVFQNYSGDIESIDTDNGLIEIRSKDDMLTTVKFFPETKLFDMSGQSILLEELKLGMSVKTEGIYDEQNDWVNTAIIFVESDSDMTSKLSGSVLQLNNDSTGFDMTDDTLGDRCVTVDDNTQIYLLSVDSTSFTSEPINLSELQSGQHLDAYGQFNQDGCFAAESLLVGNL